MCNRLTHILHFFIKHIFLYYYYFVFSYNCLFNDYLFYECV